MHPLIYLILSFLTNLLGSYDLISRVYLRFLELTRLPVAGLFPTLHLIFGTLYLKSLGLPHRLRRFDHSSRHIFFPLESSSHQLVSGFLNRPVWTFLGLYWLPYGGFGLLVLPSEVGDAVNNGDTDIKYFVLYFVLIAPLMLILICCLGGRARSTGLVDRL